MATFDEWGNRREREETLFVQQVFDGIQDHLRMMERETEEDEQISVTAFLSDGMQYPVLQIGYRLPIFLFFTVKPVARTDSESFTTVLVPYGNVRFLFEKVKVEQGQQRRKVGFLSAESVSF